MVYPDTAKWNQTNDDLRRLAIEATHPRTRERYQALYVIASRQKNATQWAEEIGRTDDTVLSWVHAYNQEGPEGIEFRHTGGRRPLFRPQR